MEQREPTVVWLETNWSLLSDAVAAYLQASTKDQAALERFHQAWQRLVATASRLDTRIPESARAALLGWAAGLGRVLPFPVAAVTAQLHQVATALELLRAVGGRRG